MLFPLIQVNTTSTQTTLVVVLVVLALALLAIGGVGFAFHQKKKAIAESSWIVSGNPDYLDTVRKDGIFFGEIVLC